MLRNRVYYFLKPFLPRSFRFAVRRWLARRLRRNSRRSWPILPGSESTPPGWQGWPDGKKFAVVLTHDVESQRGVERVLKLMELERTAGFRSSFNFIPEGSYNTPGDLRATLVQNGFEVGVHDLEHNGTLYHSRRGFTEKARQINQYLKQWGAVGFRSGFMFNRLEWLHELEIEYDASTFDTDPFEPQPEGRQTIFPIWIPKPKADALTDQQEPRRSGYVELPYTLPQDSTLFLVLREKDPRIWMEKLDWIARHGGMALLNTHPDYMAFDGEDLDHSFPAEFYTSVLDYLNSKYCGEFWQALPREIADRVAVASRA